MSAASFKVAAMLAFAQIDLLQRGRGRVGDLLPARDDRREARIGQERGEHLEIGVVGEHRILRLFRVDRQEAFDLVELRCAPWW